MNTFGSHILVVDDQKEIRELLSGLLEQHGFRVTQARDGVGLRRSLKRNRFDLVLLDLMLPGEDGFSLCRYIAEQFDLPVIIVSGRKEDFDRVLGLEMGADDYVTKPYKPKELIARIKAVIRRSERLPQCSRQPPGTEEIRFDDWRLDIRERCIVCNAGETHYLSTAEFNVLMTFLAHPHRTLTRDQILDLAYSRAAYVFDRSVDNIVCRLRKKLEADPRKPRRLVTVWGRGYIFHATVERGGADAGGEHRGSNAA
ncbi:MAG: response regulator [Hyphomicrobiales bacterium]|nr:response regulator [Hyphomicrobiales bacterium]